jgi:nitric oxide reductase subunit B
MLGVNLYTHGTHITAAHTICTAIVITIFLVLATTFDILLLNYVGVLPWTKFFDKSHCLVKISIFIFWLSPILAVVEKAKWKR